MILPPIPCCRILPGPSLCMQPAGHDPQHEADRGHRRHSSDLCGINHPYDEVACRRAYEVRRRKAQRALAALGALLLLPLLLGAKGCSGEARDPCRHVSGHGPQPCQITTTPIEGAR